MSDIIEEILFETDDSTLMTVNKENYENRYHKISEYKINNTILSVYDDNHAISRFNERFPNLTLKDYKKVLFNGIKKINKEYSLKKGFYWIISKSTGIVIPFKLYVDENDILYSMVGAIDTTYIETFKRDSYSIHGKTFSIIDSEMHDIKVESIDSHMIYESLTNKESISEWTEYGGPNDMELKHYFENNKHFTNHPVINVE